MNEHECASSVQAAFGTPLATPWHPVGFPPASLVLATSCYRYLLCVILAGIRGGEGSPSSGPNSNPNSWDYQLAQVQPVLLNKQDDTTFSLANPPKKNFSRRVQITTVGGKGGFKIKVAPHMSHKDSFRPSGRTVSNICPDLTLALQL